jgi:hypothetical protein
MGVWQRFLQVEVLLRRTCIVNSIYLILAVWVKCDGSFSLRNLSWAAQVESLAPSAEHQVATAGVRRLRGVVSPSDTVRSNWACCGVC